MAGHFFNTVEDVVTGKPVTGATVLVYVAGAVIEGDAVNSGTFATIYSDDGVTSVDQSAAPINSDSRGFFEFWTNENSVVIAISYGGTARKAISDVEITGGNVNSDITALGVRMDAVEAVTEDALVVSLAALSDPGSDKLLMWDDSESTFAWSNVYTDADARNAIHAVPTTQSGTSYTADIDDAYGYILFTNSAAIAFEIPPGVFAVRTVIVIEQNNTGVVTLTPGAGVTLNSRGGLLDTAGQYAVVQLKQVATDVWTVIGDVA